MPKIATEEQALDTILELVSATEGDREVAISATATIYSLMERGFRELAFAVLETYRPKEGE